MFILLVLFAPARTSGGDGPDGRSDPLPDLEQIERAFERLVEQVSPSVVGIRVKRRYRAALPGDQKPTGGGIFEQLVTVNGGGTIIDPRGLILTNEHVIQSAHEIEVFFHDGHSLPATLVAADARGDLAVLKVERDDLTPARMVDWSEVARGQWTITLGNPYGLANDGKLSVSVGVIANLGRRLPGLGEVDDRFYSDMIQTTAAIHPGCSGGPLFNIHGELVGVITAMHTRAPADEGVGFAIPMTPGRCRTVQELREGRRVIYGYLGLTVRPLLPEERQGAGLGPQVGAVVKEVDPGGPAGAVGIRQGDLILRFDGQMVRGPGSLAELVGQTPPGKRVSLQLGRGEQRLVVHATVQRRQISRVGWMRGGAVMWRGMRLTDLTLQVRQRLGVDAAAVGVVVIDVEQDSPAQRAAVRIGDVIEGVAEAAVRDITAFQAQVRGQQGTVRIRVRRRGELVIHP
ncbi:MAG: trypsin-like peptidase domain-containing protein [Phycisphaerae bacterium]